jgi:U4/U6 small nuclear ribonucleoprotein PRP3
MLQGKQEFGCYLDLFLPTSSLIAIKQFRPVFQPIKNEPKPHVEETKFLDPRIGQRSSVRNKRMLAFHEAGKFQAEAQRLRMKVQLEKLQSEISSIARKTGISSATQLAKLVPKGQKADKVPDIEWWDQLVLGAHNYEDWKIREGAITNLIEHPIQLQPLESTKPVHIPMFLTKREMKKLRRQNRREAWKEKQDKIRDGMPKSMHQII